MRSDQISFKKAPKAPTKEINIAEDRKKGYLRSQLL